MYPVPGHLAFSILGARYFNADLIPVIAGGFLPDLIDKPLNDIFYITPYGRCPMHSLLGVAVVTLAVHLIFNWRIAYSYMIGHLAHLIGDADFVPWFWPFIEYDYPDGIDILDIMEKPLTIFIPYWMLLELIILGLAIFLYSRYTEKRSIQAAILIAIAAIAVYRITRHRKISPPVM